MAGRPKLAVNEAKCADILHRCGLGASMVRVAKDLGISTYIVKEVLRSAGKPVAE